MKVSYLKIKNVAGIKDMEIRPGSITEITGKNGHGKTSILRAIDNIFGGGNLAEIRNNKTDENPEIVVMLDDGAIQIRKTASSLSVKKQVDETAAMEKIPAPQRFLNSLVDGKLTNPVKLLEAKPKDRTDLMLNAIPLEYERDGFCEQVGIDVKEYDAIPDGLHPLVEIDFYRDMVFKRRTGTNTEARKAADSADKLLRSVPMATPDEVDTEPLLKQLDEIKAKRTTIDKDAEHKLSSVKSELEKKMKEDSDEVCSHYDEMIRKLNIERNKELEDIKSEYNCAIDSAKNQYDADIACDKDFAVEQQRIESELKAIADADKERIKVAEIKKVAQQMEADAEQAKQKSNELTDALNAIDAFKNELCNNLPIDGLSVSNGQILIDGVPWDQVNTARQIEVAVQVSALRANDQKLKIIWVDDAEHLDSQSLELLKEQLKKHNMQPFIARVDNNDLAVKTE